MKQKVKKRLTESPEKGSVSKDYFYRMLSPQAIKWSNPYNLEEEKLLKQLLLKMVNIRNMNFIAVGAGELWYLKYGLKHAQKYVAIEPSLDVFLSDSIKYLASQMKSITLINKKFGDVNLNEIPPANSLYVFLFNILAYIENPVQTINKILRQGDILFISSWNHKSTKAKAVRKKYFDYLNSFEKEVVIDPEDTIGLCHLDNFPFQKLKYYSKHERIIGKIVDILIIYT